jgi:hypothetical protein
MPRGPCDFKQSNIKRAWRAALEAGMSDPMIEIDPRSGLIRIVPKGNGSPSGPADNKGSGEWDEAVAKLEGRSPT